MSQEDAKQGPGGGAREEAAMPYTPDDEPVLGGAAGIEAVRARHQAALLGIDGVTGVGIGRTKAGDDALVVYLKEPSGRDRVPRQLDGYPVETTVTGEIDAS